MRKEGGPRPDVLVARIAAMQHGVVSHEQLLSVGLTSAGIARRLEGGRLHRLHRGVYAVGHPAVPLKGMWMAAVLASEQLAADGNENDPATTILERWGAAVSHRSAAELWRLLEPRQGSVHVAIADRSGRKRRNGIELHRPRSLLPAHVTSHDGIPVTTPARTIADLERAARHRRSTGRISARELRRAIRQADVLGLPFSPESEFDRTRSDLERAFLHLCRAHDLPGPQVNVRIASMLVDFLWPECRLVVETDGYRYHRGRAAFEDDRARDLRLRALGYDVVRLSGRQVVNEPERVVAVLRTALSAAPGRSSSQGPGARPAAP